MHGRGQIDFDGLVEEASRHPTTGWDFAWLGERMNTTPLPWDFTRLVAERASSAQRMLDMGTGGGEWLAGLAARPPHTVATEGWAPNVPVATTRLAPLGVEVVQIETAPDNVLQLDLQSEPRLPFADGAFDLVINRHESFVAREVARVLEHGGMFLTQQIGDGVFREFNDLLGARPAQQPEWRLSVAVRQLAAADLTVEASAEGQEQVTFADVGALVWYLRMVPWTVPDFTVEAYRARLAQLQEQIDREGSITLSLPGFYIAARK
jgi:SAM-dependent methyltransferase